MGDACPLVVRLRRPQLTALKRSRFRCCKLQNVRSAAPSAESRSLGPISPAFWHAYRYDTWCAQWTLWTIPGRESELRNTP